MHVLNGAQRYHSVRAEARAQMHRWRSMHTAVSWLKSRVCAPLVPSVPLPPPVAKYRDDQGVHEEDSDRGEAQRSGLRINEAARE